MDRLGAGCYRVSSLLNARVSAHTQGVTGLGQSRPLFLLPTECTTVQDMNNAQMQRNPLSSPEVGRRSSRAPSCSASSSYTPLPPPQRSNTSAEQ